MGMVRLATVVLMIIAAPVFAVSVVTYELQLGGDNHAAAIKGGTRTAYTPGAATDGQTFDKGVLNWATSLAVSGTQSQSGHPSNGLATQGVANFVFNLELRSGSASGLLVTNTSYYSTIHSGTGALVCTDCAGGYTIPGPTAFCAGAAFTYALDAVGWGFSTVLDARSPGAFAGPFLEVGMYPTVDVGNTSNEGQLLGVGAGYGQWSRGGGLASMTTAGVGIPTNVALPLPVSPPAYGLGVVPLVEGQIDTSLLTYGTYVLKLTPGTGHNVLRGDVDLTSPPASGNPEVQAFAVPANQVNGDTITFVLAPAPHPVLAVNPADQHVGVAAGSTSFTVSNADTGTLSYTSATGNSWLHITSGGSGSCPPNGTLVVNYDQNTGPQRVGTITVTAAGVAGSPQSVTVTQDSPPPPLALVSVSSVRTHGTYGEFGIQFFPLSNASDPRTGGPKTFVATFNRSVVGPTGGVVTADDVYVSSDSGGVSVTGVTTDGLALRISLTGVVSPTRLYLEFSGVFDTDGNQVGDIPCLVVVHGDASNDRNTNTSDYVSIRGRIGQPITSSNFRYDVNADGAINTSDYVSIRGRIGQSYTGC